MKNNDPYSPGGNGGLQNDCQEKRGVHTFVEVLAVNSKWLFSLAVIGTGFISAVLFHLWVHPEYFRYFVCNNRF